MRYKKKNTMRSPEEKDDFVIENPNFDSRTIQNKEDVTYLDLFDLHNKVEITVTVNK